MAFSGIERTQGNYFSQITDTTARENIEKLAKECRTTPDAIIVTLFALMEISKRNMATAKPLASERVKTDIDLEKLADELMEEVAEEKSTPKSRTTAGKVSSVATLVTPPTESELSKLADELIRETAGPTLYDPRLSLSNFVRLDETNAISTINFICHISRNVTQTQVHGMYQFFAEAPRRFERFLQLGSANEQFDTFLRAADSDLQQPIPKFNEFVPFRTKVFEFAFTNERFEWVQIQNDAINSSLMSEMLEFEARIKSGTLIEKLESFKAHKGEAYNEWLALNTSGSSSLNSEVALRRWHAADDKKTQYAKKGSFDLSQVNLIHKALTQGEPGIDRPGAFRSGTVRIGGAGATALPPPGSQVYDMMVSYESWLMGELTKCREGKKSVILTSAQAYQRLVAIHPFENGNGRVSRLIMNHVLESQGVPPSVLGNDVLDAVFTLKPKKSRHEDEAFVRKVFQGVQKSAELIDGSK